MWVRSLCVCVFVRSCDEMSPKLSMTCKSLNEELLTTKKCLKERETNSCVCGINSTQSQVSTESQIKSTHCVPETKTFSFRHTHMHTRTHTHTHMHTARFCAPNVDIEEINLLLDSFLFYYFVMMDHQMIKIVLI